jgi:hypothetical protein
VWIVEIFKDGDWQHASEHTLQIDAESQKQRYLVSGIPENEIRISEAN